jgi:putative transcriptional regulator
MLAPAGAARSGWWMLAAAVATLVAPGANVAGQLPRGTVRQLAAGKILVAARGLPDPNFSQAVVLLADYGAEGAMGLIINRRTEVPLARAFQHLALPHERSVLYAGGPVAQTGVLALWRSTTGKDSRTVLPGVEMVAAREPLEVLLVSEGRDDRFRVFLGYAGWGAGQLERETISGSWHVFTVDADVVFDPDPASLWERQIRRTEERMVDDSPGQTSLSTSTGSIRAARHAGRNAAKPPTAAIRAAAPASVAMSRGSRP